MTVIILFFVFLVAFAKLKRFSFWGLSHKPPI